MYRLSHLELRASLVLAAALAVSSGARADALAAVQVLREGGCGGIVPLAKPLRHNTLLDQAAQQWATGRSLSSAAEGYGYRGDSAAGLYLRGTDSSMLEQLRRTSCRTVTGQTLREMGVYRRGLDTWVVLVSMDASPATTALSGSSAWMRPPSAAGSQFPSAPQLRAPPQFSGGRATVEAAPPLLASRALELVNEARVRGARCGRRTFAPAPPLTLSATLAGVAFGHAADMAQHDYFEHEDLTGQSPADRVRAVGYREKLVGENIAYGPETVEEVVQGWLNSPDHCENVMDPRFAEMGIASAAGHASNRHGLYWVQLLAAPRT